ncbi:unnamed protein product [Adineta steineri]|uniref:G-protein coupled receptors family 1 profile domain-containing protein n=1 Tax=Adineta steineri TaxID=433720 RepID=A0A814L873_9BILA|nr:unnamed protein product [Adineta steineri]CAF3501222.1 unnamed protein product [Adineta steineri]
MNIEHFEYYDLYSPSTSNLSNDTVIKYVIRFHRIYPWLLFPFGFIGSLLTILIFTRKKFQKYGCSILFVAESFMDLILITLNCIRLIIRYSFQSYFLQRSIYICRTYKFITNYFSHCAVWILCVISLERAAVTRRIVWNQNIFSHKHSYCTLIIISTVLFFLNIHYLIFFGSEQRNYRFQNNETEKKLLIMCSSNLIRPPVEPYDHFLTFYFSWMDFIINSLIPFIIILIANATVVYSVCKSHILMKQLGLRQTRSPRDTQLAYILFVSTFLFLLLTFPLRVFSVIEPYLKYKKKYLILSDGIMRFLLYLDHGCGFYFYTFTGELFRRELKKVLYEFLFLIFRRRFSDWTSSDSRRLSELSCSNGASHMIHSQTQQQQQQHESVPLQDSTSSCGGGNSGVKNSLHSLQPQKLSYHTSYHRCVYAKQHPYNSFSSSRTRLNPLIGKQNSDQTGLVKRHSSSCFESQYKTMPVPLNNLVTRDLDRKSDIPDPMSKSQSKEFFKKKQRGQQKKNSIATGGTAISNPGQSKGHHYQVSHGGATSLLGGGEDPAVVVINPHPPTTGHHTKEKRTKICCLL